MNRKQRRAHKPPNKAAQNTAPDFAALSMRAYQAGDYLRALEFCARAITAQPKIHDHKVLLAHILRNVSFKSFNPKLKELVMVCLNEAGVDYQDLSRAWHSLFLLDPAFQGDAPDLNDPFLLQGLQKITVYDVDFEAHLMRLRAGSDSPKFNKAFDAYCARVEYVFTDVPAATEPAEIDETIESIGLSDDDVSKLVRSHYEVNPYPRWSSIHVQSPTKDNSAKMHDHLVAGCGTGFGLCGTAIKYPNIKITAIDLSRASLSYAKAKAKSLKLKNITFYHADILNLDALDQRFDVIESSGVLHHMDDPIKGWRCLLEKLTPDGKMHIGLYSELGRRDVVAAREIVQQQGFEPSQKGIKAAREYICALPDDHAAKGVMARRDFYSLSDCRDLIFHQQEHRFTIPQIKDALAALGLVFDGFDHQKQSFETLDQWDAYERENPDAFRGMYQFWCSRAA
ncbi:MAG: class I SAM-dependent methyltransferase [Alcanivorax sp.]